MKTKTTENVYETTNCAECKKLLEGMIFLRKDKIVCRSCADKADGRVREKEEE